MTIQYTKPVRNNTPQVIGPYTFKDQNGSIISLGSFAAAFLELKLQGQILQTLNAIILSPTSNGQVDYGSFTFTAIGIWIAQFYVTDGSGNKVYGEPIQFRVVANADDLSLTQLPSY